MSRCAVRAGAGRDRARRDDEIMSKIVAELEVAGCHGRRLGGCGKGVPQSAT